MIDWLTDTKNIHDDDDLQQKVSWAKSGQVGLAVLLNYVEVLKWREVGSRREVQHSLTAGAS